MTRRFVPAIASIAFSLFLAIRSLPQSNPTPPSTASGIVQGMVLREGTNQPISDVSISVTGFAAARRGARGGGGPAFSAITDKDGQFLIRNVPAGQYQVRAERDGFFGPESGGSRLAYALDYLDLLPDAQSANSRLILTAGAIVSGRILDLAGRPATDTTVQLSRLLYRNGTPALQTVASDATDDRGEYRVFRIPPGEYYLNATVGQTTARGAGLFGARRGLTEESRERSVTTYYPDAVSVLQALPIVLHSSEERAGMNISLRTVTTIKVSGVVTSEVALPQREGRVNATTTSVRLTLVSRETIPDSTSARTTTAILYEENRGSFEISGIAPGVYDLFALVSNPAGTATSTDVPRYYAGRISFEAGFQDLENLPIVIKEGVDVKVGVSVDGNDFASPEVIRVQVQAVDGGASVAGYSIPASLTQAANGEIRIPFVKEALYRLQILLTAQALNLGQRGKAAPDLQNSYVEDIRENGVSVYDGGLRVGTRPTSVQILMKTNGGTVEGVVRDAAGNPRPGAFVVLAPPESRRQNPALFKTTSSDARGNFSIRQIPPGSYKLFAWTSIPDGAYQNPAFISKDEQRGQPVVVSAAATATANLVVIPASSR